MLVPIGAKTYPILLYPDRDQSHLVTYRPRPNNRACPRYDMGTWRNCEHSPILTTLPRLSLTASDLNHLRSLSRTEDEQRSSFSKLRSGKRRTEEMSTLEATIYALMMIQSAHCSHYTAAFFDHYAPLWESYERWINAQLAHRSTR